MSADVQVYSTPLILLKGINHGPENTGLAHSCLISRRRGGGFLGTTLQPFSVIVDSLLLSAFSLSYTYQCTSWHAFQAFVFIDMLTSI